MMRNLRFEHYAKGKLNKYCLKMDKKNARDPDTETNINQAD